MIFFAVLSALFEAVIHAAATLPTTAITAVRIGVHSTPGASQEAAELTRRCFEMAKGQGITEEAMRDEIGDVAEYIRGD